MNSKARSRKAEATREHILDTATRLFSTMPYHSVSIRKIGEEGNFNHGRVRYYFPSKGELFKHIVSKLCDDLIQADIDWYASGLEGSAKELLSNYLDNAIRFHKDHPHGYRIICQNLHTQDFEHIPGAEILRTTTTQLEKLFKQHVPSDAPDELMSKYFGTLNVLMQQYLGNSHFYAPRFKFKADSDEYFAWVKETLIEACTPLLEQIVGTSIIKY